MTTDRDVRLSRAELGAIEWALRDEISKRRRSIAKARENLAAGQTVKMNVLSEHENVLEAALLARDKVTANLREIDRRNGATIL